MFEVGKDEVQTPWGLLIIGVAIIVIAFAAYSIKRATDNGYFPGTYKPNPYQDAPYWYDGD